MINPSDKIQILQEKLQTAEQLRSNVFKWKSDGKKVVFTNGCFDLLHTGHITYLAKAAELGSLLA
jgi:bifunctional ADP-heptose synthase (sugar kinase/adenylyltransferase)